MRTSDLINYADIVKIHYRRIMLHISTCILYKPLLSRKYTGTTAHTPYVVCIHRVGNRYHTLSRGDHEHSAMSQTFYNVYVWVASFVLRALPSLTRGAHATYVLQIWTLEPHLLSFLRQVYSTNSSSFSVSPLLEIGIHLWIPLCLLIRAARLLAILYNKDITSVGRCGQVSWSRASCSPAGACAGRSPHMTFASRAGCTPPSSRSASVCRWCAAPASTRCVCDVC